MANVFRLDDQHTQKPNRNVYDLTKVSNITTKFGQLLPVYCKPVMNGESVQIEHQHVFNMLPLVFPVQTRVRASLSYYYCRNRNIWKDWEDFQFKMKPNLVKPYLKFTKEMQRNLLRVGGILDTLGVDTVVFADVPTDISLDNPILKNNDRFGVYNPFTNTFDSYPGQRMTLLNADATSLSAANGSYWDYADVKVQRTVAESDGVIGLKYAPYRYPILCGSVNDTFEPRNLTDTSQTVYFLVEATKSTVSEYTQTTVRRGSLTSNSRDGGRTTRPTQSSDTIQRSIGSIGQVSSRSSSVTTEGLGQDSSYYVLKITIPAGAVLSIDRLSSELSITAVHGRFYLQTEDHDTAPQIGVDINPKDYPQGIHLSDVCLKDLPYANIVRDDEKTIRLDAAPLRHYESIYNALIRNAENNPYKINGVVEYNKFIHTTEGGADSYNYPMHYRNWQDDRFTTALHTPQHGDAPLVGLVNQSNKSSNSNGYTVTFANDDGTKTRAFFNILTDSSIPRVTVKDVTSPLSDSVPEDSTGYVGQLQEAMVEAVKFGITINDFRNVNSFQRWLENNVRKGYKYRDQIKAHYGVSVRYDTLDMPEYLGGTTRDMNVNTVTQTTENENGVLGDFAGQAFINGKSDHSINHYCDEEGFIIGILSIMPTANYSQVMPKWWTRSSALDYFSPEFGKIGMQPILNREIAPVASFYENNGDKIFGYNRAWSDYLDDTDSIHGKFRTEFRNFVLTRTFNKVPTLSEDFLVYDPEQLNNIFYVDDDEDKILGSIRFEVKSRMPIPLYGIAALE